MKDAFEITLSRDELNHVIFSLAERESYYAGEIERCGYEWSDARDPKPFNIDHVEHLISLRRYIITLKKRLEACLSATQ